MNKIKNKYTGEVMLGGISLAVVIERHKKWRNGEEGGERANLQRANLQNADLWGANLQDANLKNANLQGANLQGANLWGANLQRANLQNANLWSANLKEANLRGANLHEADLWDTNLCGVKGNKMQVKSLHLDSYDIAYTSEIMQIGCKRHALEDWWLFTDEEIEKMDGSALKWWQKWKPVLQNIIEISPAEPTRNEE